MKKRFRDDGEEIVIRIKKRKLNEPEPAILISKNEDEEYEYIELNTTHELFNSLMRGFKKDRLDIEDKLLFKLIAWSHKKDEESFNDIDINEDTLINYAECLDVECLKLSDFRGLAKYPYQHWPMEKPVTIFDSDIRRILNKANVIVMDVSDFKI